jgi:hypothetical protein
LYSVRVVAGHLDEIHCIDVSPDLISAATDAVVEMVADLAERAAQRRLFGTPDMIEWGKLVINRRTTLGE